MHSSNDTFLGWTEDQWRRARKWALDCDIATPPTVMPVKLGNAWLQPVTKWMTLRQEWYVANGILDPMQRRRE